jgi:nucleotide-binding universal stress UspA family protein
MPSSILASLTGLSTDRAVMETAVAAANSDGGHILGLHARIDVVETAAMIEVTFPQRHDDLGRVIQNIDREEAERSQRAKAAFEDVCHRHQVRREEGRSGGSRLSASWRETRSFFNETLEEARYHDLVVMGRDPELSADRIKSALMQCGRPLLMAPPKPRAQLGRHIAVAWKTGAEAARALTAASSLLARAERVSILSVSENPAGDDRDKGAAGRLVTELQWRGVKAEVQMEFSPSVSTAKAIQSMAYGRDADLLIMGVYGHNRLREYILGGMTEEMLQGSCAIPVFMFR